MSMSKIAGNINQIGAVGNWFQNSMVDNFSEKDKSVFSAKENNAVKVSISQEGMKNYRKKLHESGMNGGKAIAKTDKDSIIRQAKQATNALLANNYGNTIFLIFHQYIFHFRHKQ